MIERYKETKSFKNRKEQGRKSLQPPGKTDLWKEHPLKIGGNVLQRLLFNLGRVQTKIYQLEQREEGY